MRTKWLALGLLCTSLASALEGAFINLTVGYSELRTPKGSIFNDPAPKDGEYVYTFSNSHTKGGPGESLGFGYRYNDNMGVYLDFSHVTNSKYSKQSCSMNPQTKKCSATVYDSVVFIGESVRLMGQFYIPLNDRFEFRVDGGAALAFTTKVVTKQTTDPNFDFTGLPLGTGTYNKLNLAPSVGFSLLRKIYDNYEFGVVWNRVFGKGKVDSKNYQPDQDSVKFEFRIYY